MIHVLGRQSPQRKLWVAASTVNHYSSFWDAFLGTKDAPEGVVPRAIRKKDVRHRFGLSWDDPLR